MGDHQYDLTAPARTEVEVGRFSLNDLRKRAADGDRLSPEEVSRLLEEERPTKTQSRPTGRKTRTGTEVKKESSRRVHAAKWKARS